MQQDQYVEDSDLDEMREVFGNDSDAENIDFSNSSLYTCNFVVYVVYMLPTST